MPHNIFGERFLGRREPAWHELGQVFHEPLTASEAVARCRVDYHVILAPCYAKVNGQYFPISDKQVVLRTPTPDHPVLQPLGVVSEDYQPVQNAEIARLLDPISEEWPVETVGALGMDVNP